MAGLHWPGAHEHLPQRGLEGLVKRTKYRWRLLVTRPLRAEFMDTVASHPAWHELHQRHPNALYPLLCHFVDRRFSRGRRFEVAQADLQVAQRLFGLEGSAAMARGERLTLGTLPDGTSLVLGLNDVSWHEGRWALSLRNAEGQRLYNLSFAFLPCGALLVGAVQGPQAGTVDAETVIRDLTKTAEGVRPPYLLAEALRAAAAAWGVNVLLGIDPVHHVKGRWNVRGRRLRFDYRNFWAELGGTQRPDGYWQLPLQVAPRDLAEVPSRKRAMYRRRQALLEALRQSIQGALRAAADPQALAA